MNASNAHSSAISLLCIFVFVCLESVYALPAEPKIKPWKSSDGKYGLVSATPSKVVLVKLSDQKQFDGTWLKLPLNLRKEIATFWANQDREQLAKLRKLMAGNQDHVKGIYEQLKALHLDYPMSPYAGIALGVSYAGLQNEPEKAAVVLKQAMLRLETQRGASPGSHTHTLATCYCDLAICALKDKKAENGMGYLIKSIDSEPLPVAIHNASQLLTVSQNPNSYLKLTDAQHGKLLKVIEGLDTQEKKIETGWHYSLSIDEPPVAQNSRFTGTLGFTPPADNFKIIDTCLGVAVSDNAIVFPSRLCEPGQVLPLFLSYHLPYDSNPQTIPIREVVVEVENTSTPFRSDKTKFRTVPKVSAKHQGLAVFRVADGLRDVAKISNMQPAAESELLIHSIDNSKKDKLAVVSTKTLMKPTGLHSDAVSHLNSPVFSASGDFLGFVTPQGSSPPYVPPAKDLTQWLEKSARVDLSNSRLPRGTGIVVVISWADSSSEGSSTPLCPGISELSEIVRDQWCIPCSGKGFFKCPHCLRGVVSYKDVAATGVNPLTQTPVFSTVVKQKPCDACDAKGVFDCPHCVHGRLADRQ